MGGQYFKIVILDKNKNIRIWLDPYDYGEGYHLMQHAFLNTHLMGAIEYLISPQGQYYKSPIIWAGDFAEPQGDNIYSKCNLCYYNKQSPPAYDTRCYRYVVNYTKKMYVDKYPDGDCGKTFKINIYKIHPLPLLVMDNKNGGKGSYEGEDEHLLGTWSGDIISVELEPPEKFIKLNYNFN
jgi:hypothetical protein